MSAPPESVGSFPQEPAQVPPRPLAAVVLRCPAYTPSEVSSNCVRCGSVIDEHPEQMIQDRLFSGWIDEAPRFGAVAAHFPDSLRKRRFTAGFWAPEVMFSASAVGPFRRMGEESGGWYCGGWRTRGMLDAVLSVEVGGAQGPTRFWSSELPEVRVLPRRSAEHRGGTALVSRLPIQGEIHFRGPRGWHYIAAFLLLLCLALPTGAQSLFGTVTRITDGDTLVVGKARVRLHGIDAPEGSQTCMAPSGQAYRCGDSSEGFLARLAPPGSHISCLVLDTDRYGRLVARCAVGQKDLGSWMVRSGWAVAFRKYSTDYVAVEDEARMAKRGMWAGSFVVPELWRKGVRK